MTTRSYRDGPNVVFYDTHRHRIVDVIGPTVQHAFKGLGNVVQPNTVDPSGWTSTVVEVGAGTTEFDPDVTTNDYVATITTAAGENDGGSYQAPGAAFTCRANQKFYAGLEIALDDVLQSDLFFGVAVTDTALLGGVSDGVYFEKLDGGATVSAVTEKDSSETQNDSLATLVNDTNVALDIFWDGTSALFYIDGALVATHVLTLPNDEGLRLSIEFLAGAAAAKVASIAWMRAFAWT